MRRCRCRSDFRSFIDVRSAFLVPVRTFPRRSGRTLHNHVFGQKDRCLPMFTVYGIAPLNPLCSCHSEFTFVTQILDLISFLPMRGLCD